MAPSTVYRQVGVDSISTRGRDSGAGRRRARPPHTGAHTYATLICRTSAMPMHDTVAVPGPSAQRTSEMRVRLASHLSPAASHMGTPPSNTAPNSTSAHNSAPTPASARRDAPAHAPLPSPLSKRAPLSTPPWHGLSRRLAAAEEALLGLDGGGQLDGRRGFVRPQKLNLDRRRRPQPVAVGRTTHDALEH